MKPLYPIMAVVVIASAGALPLRARAADGAQADANHPMNAMQSVIGHESEGIRAQAREDAGVRIREFMGEFTKSGLPAAEASDLAAMAYNWGKTSGSVADVSHFYFVIGPGLVQPTWAKNNPVLERAFTSASRGWRERHRAALAKYVTTPIATPAHATAFLNEAAAAALAAFNDARTRPELDADIERRREEDGTPDTRRGGEAGSRLNGAMRQYTLDDLYRDGAKWGDVAGPDDKGSRRISIKIFSKRLPSGEIVNEIGIFDITDNNDMFGQRFPLDQKTNSFILDDRTAGNKKYELNFGVADAAGNRTITFQRPGGGHKIETSVSELLRMRADQAQTMGNIVKVGGQEFYTLPQGGKYSALALFPKDMIDGRATIGDPRDLKPALYAEIGERGPDGRNINIRPPANSKGGPHLGTVGDKEYRLEFNKTTGVWEVKEGAGDIPAPPAAPTAAAGGDPTTGGTPAGGNPSAGGGEMSLAAKEALVLREPNCRKNPDDVKDLAPELRGRYSILTCSDPRAGKRAVILFPSVQANPEGQLEYGTMKIGNQDALLQRARFAGNYLVLAFDGYTQYSDVRQFEGREMKRRGSIQNRSASNFEEIPPFVDALRNHMGITGGPNAGAADAVPARARQAAGNKPFDLHGSFAGDGLIVTIRMDGRHYAIWPNQESPDGSGPAPSNAYQNINGPTNAMDNTRGTEASADAPFPTPAQFLAQSRKLQQLRAEPSGATPSIIMLETVPVAGQPTPKSHFIMFKFKAVDDPSKPEAERKVVTFLQQQFEIFNSTSPLPQGYQMLGLTGVDDPVVADRMKAGYRFVPGSSATKGAFIMVQNKQLQDQNQTSVAANCVGPLVWWGMSLGEAQTACKQDKL